MGYRNAQLTLVPPAGTISFQMDACTTGLEPPYALKIQKRLIEGRTISSFNPNVEKALIALGYEDTLRSELLVYCAENGHFEGSKLKECDLPVFDCSIPVKTRCLSIDAHLDMVAAISPHISGAASKTFNMPNSATVRDIELTILRAWERGIKGIAIYRAGSKMSEPLRVKEVLQTKKKELRACREELPNDRKAVVHKFSIQGFSGYVTLGFFADGRVGEIWLRLAKPGSTVAGLLDAVAKSWSYLIQFGMPLSDLVRIFEGTRFSPAGITSNPDIVFATSILDYVAKFLKTNYLSQEEQAAAGLRREKKIIAATALPAPEVSEFDWDLNAEIGRAHV
jgi:ribonucleoside-diphosphate reductase alpha chain